jgi:hypothetical protein
MPQAEGAAIEEPLAEGALTAKTDSCLSSAELAHFGHSSFVDWRTSNSK